MNRRQRRALQHATRQNSPHRPAAPPTPETEPDSSAPGHSTGPRTEEGKAAASRNAVRHGLCATKLVGADLEELNAIRAGLDEEWEPATETEKLLLQQMALSQWRLDRALQLEIVALEAENAIDPAALALPSATALPRNAASIKRSLNCSASEPPGTKMRFAKLAARRKRRPPLCVGSKPRSLDPFTPSRHSSFRKTGRPTV